MTISKNEWRKHMAKLRSMRSPESFKTKPKSQFISMSKKAAELRTAKRLAKNKLTNNGPVV